VALGRCPQAGAAGPPSTGGIGTLSPGWSSTGGWAGWVMATCATLVCPSSAALPWDGSIPRGCPCPSLGPHGTGWATAAPNPAWCTHPVPPKRVRHPQSPGSRSRWALAPHSVPRAREPPDHVISHRGWGCTPPRTQVLTKPMVLLETKDRKYLKKKKKDTFWDETCNAQTRKGRG